MPAPIVLFVYNRLDKTKATLEALQKNILALESDLFIYSDGPKAEKDYGAVQDVRNLLKTIPGFKSVTVIERKKNLGLAESVIKGVTEIVNKFGQIIVLEDDLETSPYFLKYMNDALELYKDEGKVISIHGYIYPVKEKLPEYFFLKGADCWGWATWKRGWELFESDGKKLLSELEKRKLSYEFDFNGSYHFTEMLKDQVEGKSDSWAIRWYASAFLKNKFTLYPGKSFIVNTGTDGTGTHCVSTDQFNSQLRLTPLVLTKIPVEEDASSFKAIVDFFKGPSESFIKKIIRKIKVSKNKSKQ